MNRNFIRTGIIFAALLLSPAAAGNASPLLLQPTPPAEESKPVASPGCPGGAPHIDCLLEGLLTSLSAD